MWLEDYEKIGVASTLQNFSSFYFLTFKRKYYICKTQRLIAPMFGIKYMSGLRGQLHHGACFLHHPVDIYCRLNACIFQALCFQLILFATLYLFLDCLRLLVLWRGDLPERPVTCKQKMTKCDTIASSSILYKYIL